MNIEPLPKLIKLGDLVNIIQRYYNIAENIYINDLNAIEMIKFLLSLFETKLKLIDYKPANIEYVSTTWTNLWPNEFGTMCWSPKDYKKAINLPFSQQSHIVCQFDTRTPTSWDRNIKIDNIYKICQSFSEIYNIGDRELPFVKNCNKFSLSEKYDLLSTAKAYIGINSGLSHLSLMTNTKTYILYETNNPWFFYPNSSNILQVDDFINFHLESIK